MIKRIKGDVKNQPKEDTEKILAPDGIRTHDPSNPIWGSDFFCVLLWLILYISLYFLYNNNNNIISGINLFMLLVYFTSLR